MATITFNIPDDQVTRVTEAFATRFGWNTDLGVTKVQFAKQQLVQFARDVVQTHELRAAEEQARADVMAASPPTIT